MPCRPPTRDERAVSPVSPSDAPFVYPRRFADRILDLGGSLERHARRLAKRALRGEATARPPLPPFSGPSGADAPVLLLPAVGWDYRFQRPQQLAAALARSGRPVLYCDPFARRLLGSPRRLAPLAPALWHLDLRLPGRPDPYRHPLGESLAARLARHIAEGVLRAPCAVLAQLPFWTPVGEELRRLTGAPLIYDRLDRHRAFPGIPPAIAGLEERLLASADRVIATSEHLLPPERPDATLIRNAVAPEDFRLRRRRPRDAAPIVGYAGALGEWLDAEALETAARELPSWRFRLAGRVEDPALRRLDRLPNVELLGEIPYARVPSFLAGLDLATVPFRDTELTRAVDPVKLYEALATGLPVVARRLPETQRWEEPHVYLYDAAASFPDILRHALLEDDEGLAETRRRRVRDETWDRRARDLESLW